MHEFTLCENFCLSLVQQPPRHIILLVYKPLQDYEVHSLAQIQMDFHLVDCSSAGSVVLGDPALLSTRKITQFSQFLD